MKRFAFMDSVAAGASASSLNHLTSGQGFLRISRKLSQTAGARWVSYVERLARHTTHNPEAKFQVFASTVSVLGQSDSL
jgi:hypothetical protein